MNKINFYKKLIIILFSIIYLPWFTDPDIWWHLRLGKEILEGNIFHNNLTFTCVDYVWNNYSWLSDLLMYNLFNKFGYLSLAILTSLVFIIGILINFETLKYFLKERGYINKLNIFSLILFLNLNYLILFSFVYARPQVFGVLFSSIIFNRLVKSHINKFVVKDYIIIGITIVLWANLHGSFIIGIVLSLLFILQYLIQLVLLIIRKEKKDKVIYNLNKLYNMIPILLELVLLPLFNPFGFNLWTEVLSSITSNLNALYITEWGPINFHSQQGLIYLLIISIYLGLVIFNKKN